MFYKLPPAGNPIVVSGGGRSRDAVARNWSPFAVHWYGSGTSALAAAVSAAIVRKAVPSPEVLVPAYGCPNVASAVLFAGAKPVLVDFAPQRPWLDLDAVERCASRNTVAIIAINFLGIQERVELLRAKATAVGATLIEDCAQSFPIDAEDVASLGGDLVVLSFGRGKPVSLLGGGAVLARTAELARVLPQVGFTGMGIRARIRFRLRVASYNMMRRPRAYWLLDGLPFLGLGRTVYKPLHVLEAPAASIDFLGNNIDAYRLGGEPQRRLRALMEELPDGRLIDLPATCGVRESARLLRYPLLLDSEACRRLDTALRRAGLGSSRLYRHALSAVPEIPSSIRDQGDFPRARHFAESLLTLPTHAQVDQRDIDRMAEILRTEFRRRNV